MASFTAKKSSNDIPNQLTKLAPNPLPVPFTQIYNQSIETGIAPNVLKILQFTPVYINGDVIYPRDYRLISPESPFSKVLIYLLSTNNLLGKNVTFCTSTILGLAGKVTELSKLSQKSLIHLERLWIRNWLLVVSS